MSAGVLESLFDKEFSYFLKALKIAKVASKKPQDYPPGRR
ncbi:hypothetical protein SAMCFNEI73_pB0247 (plasmid) [Sinorhizobium americanum]|uniref:Uncharacterized protein n=1 Tax=Sinorhizobium americanum TaxID=194963 RepID=A0A1L3LTM7_9HYPH|nr:hypothetical protein SAMCFNEI73_pB0247 [Sinorhizobium americanum]